MAAPKLRATLAISLGPWAGWTLADFGPRRHIQARGDESHAWRAAPLRLLTRDYPADDPIWTWLREHGAVRKSPSGPSGTTQPESERRNVQVLLRLAPDVAAHLRAAAERDGVNVSAWVARAVARR